jgi:hypothetical protein
MAPKFPLVRSAVEASKEVVVNAVEIQTHAHKLFEVHGTKALAEAAQMVRQFEERGEKSLAEDWRRIEKALQQLRGPNVS